MAAVWIAKGIFMNVGKKLGRYFPTDFDYIHIVPYIWRKTEGFGSLE